MPDGHDHSALISISVAPSTGTLNMPMYVANNVTGDTVTIYQPFETIKTQTST